MTHICEATIKSECTKVRFWPKCGSVNKARKMAHMMPIFVNQSDVVTSLKIVKVD